MTGTLTPATAWLIRTGDLYWRPRGGGYTANLLEAGVYSEEDAKLQERVGGRDRGDTAVKLTHELSGFMPAQPGTVAALLRVNQ